MADNAYDFVTLTDLNVTGIVVNVNGLEAKIAADLQSMVQTVDVSLTEGKSIITDY